MNFWSNAQKCCLFWGGMRILLEICEKRPFQKCVGWGGGGVDGHIFVQTELQIRQCTRRSSVRGTTDYSESELSSLLPPSTRAGTTCWTFFSKSTSMHMAKNSCCEASVGCTLPSQNWLAKEAASAVVRIWCSLWVHAGCCEPAVRGLFALLGDLSCVTRTQSAPPERAPFRTNGFCGACGDATTPAVNLYADMVAAC